MVLLIACESQEYLVGASEPVRVHGGVFHEGVLPVDEAATTPLVLNAGSVGAILTAGQASVPYTGLVTPDAYSVAVAFPTLGTGFWVVPVDGPDVTQEDALLFDVTADVTTEAPFGLQTLSFVAIDGDGAPGPRYDTTVCILPEVATHNLAYCDPNTTPQSAVISLSWDTDVDLDLIVVAPSGKVVSSKLPSTALPPDGTTTIPTATLNDPTTGQLTRDSNANCDVDSIRRESLVFPGEPPAGDYRIYASLHATCGHSYVNWLLSVYRRVDADDGTHPVERTDVAAGELLGAQATGGATFGTFITTLTLP